ncbi:MAG: hypothetical protein ACRDLS_02470 [Solirubrobacteraceae bacterium]
MGRDAVRALKVAEHGELERRGEGGMVRQIQRDLDLLEARLSSS